MIMKEKLKNVKQEGIYAIVKTPTKTETIRLNRLSWFVHVQRMEENRIPPKKYCI